jgi:hypothetical protein
MVVRCAQQGCSETWYRPSHDPHRKTQGLTATGPAADWLATGSRSAAPAAALARITFTTRALRSVLLAS